MIKIFEKFKDFEETWIDEPISNKPNYKKRAIENILIDFFRRNDMDLPDNFHDIVDFCYNDVCETADPEYWHDGDVMIAFRRWIESKNK